MLLLPLLLFLSSQTMRAMEDSSLYRNPTGDFSVGDFSRNLFHYLWVKKITSSMVTDQLDCTFLCVGEPKCYSFNMAAYPDSKGLYLCELLATDKYRATNKFHANATFHHYSPAVIKICSLGQLRVFCWFINTGCIVITNFHFIFSLHVKAILARTEPTVFLIMKWTPIAATVSWDSVELAVTNEVKTDLIKLRKYKPQKSAENTSWRSIYGSI